MIQFQSISHAFGTAPVLRDVTFSVPPGQTLGLVGENGAGKSTLMNILGGNLKPRSGSMRLGGEPYHPRSPAEAEACGVAFIHQELNLFPNLSIAENIFLTRFPTAAGWIRKRQTLEETGRLLAEVGLDQRPETPVERLSAGQRQLVEIARALHTSARLVIFDEPTSSLSARETGVLFQLLEGLRRRGISLIYISHTLPDVLRLADWIVVLRDGAVAGAGPRSEFTEDRLVSLMVGRSLTQLYPARIGVPGTEVLLEARGLTQPGIARDISFRLHRREVLGVAGLMGAGRSELARILFGLAPCERGDLLLNGQPLRTASTAQRIRRGLAFVTENRREEGLCLAATIAENTGLAALRQFARGPFRFLDRPRLRQAIAEIRAAVRVTASASDAQPAGTLSGGNQQKVVLAKWLLARPGVLILDEPTRGIDIGAKHDLYQLIHQLAEGGAGVLMISSEIEELIGVCDRLLVMAKGEIRDVLARPEFDRERILRAALGTQA